MAWNLLCGSWSQLFLYSLQCEWLISDQISREETTGFEIWNCKLDCCNLNPSKLHFIPLHSALFICSLFHFKNHFNLLWYKDTARGLAAAIIAVPCSLSAGGATRPWQVVHKSSAHRAFQITPTSCKPQQDTAGHNRTQGLKRLLKFRKCPLGSNSW